MHVFFLCLIRSRKSKDRQYNGQKKKDKWTMIYITLHRNIKIEQHEPIQNRTWTLVLRGRLNSSRSTCCNHRVTSCCKPGDESWMLRIHQMLLKTIQPSHYNLISWRLVSAIVITWPLLDTTWVWNVDFGLVLEWWRCKKKTLIASESILLSKRTLPWSSVCSMHNGLFILITQLKKNRQ